LSSLQLVFELGISVLRLSNFSWRLSHLEELRFPVQAEEDCSSGGVNLSEPANDLQTLLWLCLMLMLQLLKSI